MRSRAIPPSWTLTVFTLREIISMMAIGATPGKEGSATRYVAMRPRMGQVIDWTVAQAYHRPPQLWVGGRLWRLTPGGLAWRGWVAWQRWDGRRRRRRVL